jgi:hypothetical protein
LAGVAGQSIEKAPLPSGAQRLGWLPRAEESAAHPRDDAIAGIPHRARDQPEDPCRAVMAGCMERGDDAFGLVEVTAVCAQPFRKKNQGLEIMGGQPVLNQPDLGGWALQWGEAELAAPIERQQAMNHGLAKATFAIEEEHRVDGLGIRRDHDLNSAG